MSETANTTLYTEKPVKAELLAEAIERLHPQILEGIEQTADGKTYVRLKEKITPEQAREVEGLMQSHDPTIQTDGEKRDAVRVEAIGKLEGVDYRVLKQAIDAISNAQIKAGFIELLKLNYRLAAAAGWVIEKPPGIDD